MGPEAVGRIALRRGGRVPFVPLQGGWQACPPSTSHPDKPRANQPTFSWAEVLWRLFHILYDIYGGNSCAAVAVLPHESILLNVSSTGSDGSVEADDSCESWSSACGPSALALESASAAASFSAKHATNDMLHILSRVTGLSSGGGNLLNHASMLCRSYV
jgi:hypothetical protein